MTGMSTNINAIIYVAGAIIGCYVSGALIGLANGKSFFSLTIFLLANWTFDSQH